MATATCDVESALSKVVENLNSSREENLKIVLKAEQKTAIIALLNSQDVLAILPTGFGKSLIFKLFVLVKETLENKTSTVIVITPLKSIISDQIADMEDSGCSAVELTDTNMEEVAANPPQFIFCSAEQALCQEFKTILLDKKCKLFNSLNGIAVDESHVVETWTGQRAKGRKASSQVQVFRGAFGKLSILRALCKEGLPIVALTGTADKITQKVICKELVLRKPVEIFVSPNRTNLRVSVEKVSKDVMLSKLDWVVQMVKQHGINTPKTIIFCDSLYAVARVVNYLIMKLSEFAFSPASSKKREHCIVGIFHAYTQHMYKHRIMDAMKGQNTKRVIVATTALSMGVNFPDVRYVIIYGPPRNLLDILQEAGRAGRDNLPADVVINFYGQQLAHCDDEVKDFLKSESCYRVSAYRPFDRSICPLKPSHDCCNLCSKDCKCSADGNDCEAGIKPFETVPMHTNSNIQIRERLVTDEDRITMEAALREIMNKHFCSTDNILGQSSSHGFSEELIKDVIDNCQKLFSIQDIVSNLPIFSKVHALIILELLGDIFGDIDELTSDSDVLSSSEHYVLDMEEILSSDFTESLDLETEIDWI